MYYYGVDLREVIAGNGPAPLFVVNLIDGLPEGSMTISLMRDEDNYHQHLGRSAEWYVLADLYDATNQNTRATGNWKKGKTPKFEPYPRPGTKPGKKAKRDAPKPTSLADLYGQVGGATAPK